MTTRLAIAFTGLDTRPEDPAAFLVGAPDLAMGERLGQIDQQGDGCITRAAVAGDFTGKARATLEVLGLGGKAPRRLVLVGAGEPRKSGGGGREQDWINLGGVAYAALASRKGEAASFIGELKEGSLSADEAADVALGALLRSYKFERYRTKRGEAGGEADGEAKEGKNGKGLARLTLHVRDPEAASAAFDGRRAVAEGVMLARDLVNEPANVLGPVEFAEQTRALEELGVEVEILEPAALTELKMGALLGVAQGSARPARVVVMQWLGAKSKRARPVCLIGKGVCFDTGGISIKPAAGMEDMKGDMGGAAAVVGTMRALAGRRAPVNVVGLIGLVENMPSHTAQRPGDIVTSMSGQTIEVINTDAEGRLVLADVMWYAQDRWRQPRCIIDLATLTGAIMVALGKEHAGLFSNDDKLAAALAAAGEATGEKVWRMPLGKAYDKLIDSKIADMKNVGGRFGGSITAAQFLQRFVKDKETPWAHLDVAGTAMDSGKSDINQSWGSGWGVRLLDRLIADTYE